jgi:hypothetical protein
MPPGGPAATADSPASPTPCAAMDLSANRQADSEDMDQDEGGPASGESGVLQIMDEEEEEEEEGPAFRENLQEMVEEGAIKPVTIITLREKIAKIYAAFFKQQREENEKVKQKEMAEKEQARLDASFKENDREIERQIMQFKKEKEEEEEMKWKKEKEEEEEKEKEKKMINDYHTPPRDKRGFARAAPLTPYGTIMRVSQFVIHLFNMS